MQIQRNQLAFTAKKQQKEPTSLIRNWFMINDAQKLDNTCGTGPKIETALLKQMDSKRTLASTLLGALSSLKSKIMPHFKSRKP